MTSPKGLPKEHSLEWIRTLAGLSQARFGEFYSIPKRTIEEWEAGRRKPPEYVLKLLERAVKEDFKGVTV